MAPKKLLINFFLCNYHLIGLPGALERMFAQSTAVRPFYQEAPRRHPHRLEEEGSRAHISRLANEPRLNKCDSGKIAQSPFLLVSS